MALVMSGELLVPGRHAATLAEVHQTFVAAAPFPYERERIFTALLLYIGEVKVSLPGTASIWVNGGFVTHKTWAAPHDVDVAMPVLAADFNALKPTRRTELFTQVLSPVDRIQPMAGLIDAFPFDLSARAAYGDGLWSQVTDAAKNTVPGAIKGYVEVAI